MRLILLLAVLAGCASPKGETYGFVATLGDDTTSVERVTRSHDHIVSDAVGRSPTVTRRHWEADLAPDGTITKWWMDTWIPNAPADAQHLHHTAQFSGQLASLSRGTAAGTRKFAYTTQYAATVPWNAFVYGSYEPLLDAVRRQGDTARIGQYFFEGWDEGHIGYAVVKRMADGSYSLESTGLAGAGLARLDSSGHLVSYSGQGTTYKQEVRRVASVPDIDSLTSRFAADEKSKGVASELSPRSMARGTVGKAMLTIDYSRPARRGRTLVGGLIPYGEVWRTGANAATQFNTSEPIQLAGIPLRAGTYTLWTLPSSHGVELIVNGQHGQWGTEYDEAQDIARRPMTMDSTPSSVELFTITFAQDSTHVSTGHGAPQTRLVMAWGTFRWSVPVAASGRD